MMMRRIDGIALPPARQRAVAGARPHVMMLGLKAPLKEGDKFPSQCLSGERGGEVTVTVNVEGPGGRSFEGGDGMEG